MTEFIKASQQTKAEFAKLFADYYEELGCDEDGGHLIEEYIMPDLEAGLLYADLAIKDGNACAFCIYQRDEARNEWNFREGWGDIREIYVAPALRRQGIGRALAERAEKALIEAGAENVYALPADPSSADFFAACGYELTDDVCEELECNVFAKKL